MNTSPRGRQFFFNPGPTNIPDRILGAMHRATLDFHSDEFLAIHRAAHAGTKRILKTKQNLFLYAANGHGAWEASLVNLLSPGDKVLMLESGHFSMSWEEMCKDLGIVVETIHADWRKGVDPAEVTKRLKQDGKGEIKAVLVVHNETATGLVHPIADIRRAIDAAKHAALLLTDTISGLGCMDFRFDEWGVDVAVSGSQKGLMMPTGLSLTGVSNKALEASKKGGLPRHYWSWRDAVKREPQKFPGTTPVHLFFGLEEAVKQMDEEGLDAIFARHRRFARATRAAVTHWGGGAKSSVTVSAKGFSGPVKGIEVLANDPARTSSSVTAIVLPDGHDANALRTVAIKRFNLSLGGGLGPLGGRVFRIGHMGDLNEPMLLGAIATVELALGACRVPHQQGGITAAIAALAE